MEADAVRVTVLLGHEHDLHARPDTILIDGAKKRGHSNSMALILFSANDPIDRWIQLIQARRNRSLDFLGLSPAFISAIPINCGSRIATYLGESKY